MLTIPKELSNKEYLEAILLCAEQLEDPALEEVLCFLYEKLRWRPIIDLHELKEFEGNIEVKYRNEDFEIFELVQLKHGEMFGFVQNLMREDAEAWRFHVG